MSDYLKRNIMILNGNMLPRQPIKRVPTKPPVAKEAPEYSLEIKPLPTAKSRIPQRPLMEANVIPRHPSSVIFNGSSGSGKSVLLLNMLTRPEFFGNYFDEIHLFSPTGGSDDLFELLELDEAHTHIDMKVEELNKILEAQRATIESDGVDKAPKLLIIFEDCQGNSRFMRSKSFLRSFIANRHYGISTWLCGQSWTRTPKACRLQANNIFYFAGSGSENELMAGEYCPPGMKKRDFMKLLQQGTRDRYNFVHINSRVPHEDRYRRNLDSIIRWKEV